MQNLKVFYAEVYARFELCDFVLLLYVTKWETVYYDNLCICNILRYQANSDLGLPEVFVL